ncbi:hypothetical protein OAW23_08840 [Flavobacteriales bacterium]|nr:hypothetical protein [Flavobacteriales bacterium]
MFENWNIKDKLIEERAKLATSYDPVKIAKAIYIEQEFEDHRIQKALNECDNDYHHVDETSLDSSRIYTLNEIKKIAINYRLRFLPSKYFIGEIPYPAIMEIKELNKLSGTNVRKFRILAPARRFELEDENADPLLFTPLLNGKYYLIHQWGNDLAWYKKVLFFPLRSFKHMVCFALTIAFIVALVTPGSVIMRSSRVLVDYFDYYRIAFFFFMSIAFCAITVFSAFIFRLFPSDFVWKKKTF